ncbi:XrtA/PEP-CTERM system exopolysaccharide export protein [Iodidimonas sp. SYSU 1G8]|uniref:XrtA/PEP-CTERM system exopolysaccharide export protein n=1 Tax=Iodidimonas sp. SYSU 1G8 TaxID=3133967 RepID=UPI0031FE9BA9
MKNVTRSIILGVMVLLVAACGARHGSLPSAEFVSPNEGPGPDYIIGPLDTINVFVWRNQEVTTTVTVRPDGRISVPLIEDLAATGKTPTQLARDIEQALSKYIRNPIVTVIVSGFTGPFAQQVRVVGEATEPQAIPFRSNMTLLDVMISVGGLTEYAAGNRSTLVRYNVQENKQEEYTVRISDLIRDGDTSANVKINPGDVIIIPESFF